MPASWKNLRVQIGLISTVLLLSVSAQTGLLGCSKALSDPPPPGQDQVHLPWPGRSEPSSTIQPLPTPAVSLGLLCPQLQRTPCKSSPVSRVSSSPLPGLASLRSPISPNVSSSGKPSLICPGRTLPLSACPSMFGFWHLSHIFVV